MSRRAAGWVVVFVLLAAGMAAVGGGPTVGGSGEASRLDPALVAWLRAGEAEARGALSGLQTAFSPAGETRVKVLARAEGAVGRELGGVRVAYSVGDVASLAVTREELARVAADPHVVYVEASWRTSPSLDVSVPTIRADLVHEATPAVNGAGVVIGFVDTGIDFRHLDFRYDGDGDGTEESSRILALWDQTYGLFGTVYDRQDIEGDLASGALPGMGTVKAVDRDGHGTHVAGIAVGDGSSSGGGFSGVAPAAWIIAVKTTFFTADILEAAGYIFDEAERRGLPAVVNLSLGGQEGPHDGTSAFERGLDEFVGVPGRAIVVSAGNEGDLPVHISGSLQGGSRTFGLEAGGAEASMQIWYPGTSRFSVTATSPGGTKVSAAAGAGSGFVPTPDGVAYIDNASAGTNPNNGDREALVRITGTSSGTKWQITVRDDSGGGRFDAWLTATSGKIVGGDSASTVDEPGNARGAITVGAWDTKATWPSELGDQDDSDEVTVGGLSSYSSQGPTRDGRTKPDLTAPGTWICAALSSSAPTFVDLTNPDGVHVMHRGTSMAAPHVAGTIALLFDVDPGLASDEVRELLRASASRDAYTGAVPNARWGYGKLDAWASIQAVEAVEPPPPSGDRPSVSVEHNPAVDEATFVYTVPEGAQGVSLRVYDVTGMRVFETALAVAGSSFVWDLETSDGDRLASGLYLYVVATDRGSSEVERLVISP